MALFHSIQIFIARPLVLGYGMITFVLDQQESSSVGSAGQANRVVAVNCEKSARQGWPN
jgi:hypothetical protein